MSLFDDLQNAGLPVVSATDIPGKPRQATFSRSLSDDEAQLYHDILNPALILQRARQSGARAGLSLAGQFRTATAQQAADYVQAQITNGTTEVQALTAFDNAYGNATPAAILAALRPILRNMLISIYRVVDILKLIARILVAIRDYVMPEVVDE